MLRSAGQRSFCLLLLVCATFTALPSPVSAQLAENSTLTPAMKAEFGAAAWIPADAGLFAASYRSREQLDAFLKTNAYQELYAMPGVQMGLAWLDSQPYLGQLEAMRNQNELLDQAILVLQDAASQEIFVYVDSRGPEFFNAVNNLYNTVYFQIISQGITDSINSNHDPKAAERYFKEYAISAVLAAQEDLHLPGFVIGARLSDPQTGHELIAKLQPLIGQMLPIPLPLQKESLGAGEYLTLHLDAAELLTPEILAKIEWEIGQDELEEEILAEFMAFIKSQTVSISIGMRGDYLLFSIGADTSQLSNLGQGISLAECDALAPIRKNFKRRLVGLNYIHADFTGTGKMDVEGLVNYLQDNVDQLGVELPEGLVERFTIDARNLLTEVNELLPEAQPYMASSFWNEGYESFTFSALAPGTMDASSPLSILAHAGPAPILAWASKSPPSLPSYNSLTHWMQVAYGYFDDYLVPEIPAEDLADYRRFEAIVLPAIKRIHVATRDSLIPAVDGGQSLFVIDAGGLVTNIPTTQEPIKHPIRFPRIAYIAELKDREKLLIASREYRDTFNQLMTDLATENPDADFQSVQLPLPDMRTDGDRTLYTYAIPEEYNLNPSFNNDFEPHVMLTEDYFTFAISPQQSQQMLTTTPLPTSSIVDLEQPSSSALWIDIRMFKELIFDDVEAVMALAYENEEFPLAAFVFAKAHADMLRKALGAVHSYRSRTYEADGRRVTHGWLKLQDIEK